MKNKLKQTIRLCFWGYLKSANTRIRFFTCFYTLVILPIQGHYKPLAQTITPPPWLDPIYRICTIVRNTWHINHQCGSLWYTSYKEAKLPIYMSMHYTLLSVTSPYLYFLFQSVSEWRLHLITLLILYLHWVTKKYF